MTWQLFLTCFLILGTIVALLQRQLGKTIPQYNRLVNGFFFIGVHYPLAIITALIIGFNAHISWNNIIILFIVGISYPLTNILAYRASKNVDAGLFGIINNLSPVITIALAGFLLAEDLTSQQFAGALIIVLSALSVSIVAYSRSSKSTRIGITLALLSVVLLGLDTVFESWMLKRIGMGSLLVYGLGFQTLWMAVFAWPQRGQIGSIINREYGPKVLTLSLAKSIKGIAFIAALYMSKSAAIVGAFTGFLPVMIVVSAYFFLKEKSHIKVKISAALAGLIGLVILSLG
jgi:drug/metabolite transporter (DMT)-like permease